MRPAGEVRSALRAAFAVATRDGQAVEWAALLPDLAAIGIDARSRAEVALVRRTVERMVQAGELQRVGSVQHVGSRAVRATYTYTSASAARGGSDLARVVNVWVRAASGA